MSDEFDRSQDHTSMGRLTPQVQRSALRARFRRADVLSMRWRAALLALSGAGTVAIVICLWSGHALLGLATLAAVLIILFGLVFGWES